MNRTPVNYFLVVYLVVIWSAVLLRVDHFPLTWAPMYSTYTSKPTISVRVVDKERMAKGLFVTHRDGSTSYLSRKDLNLPKWHFWRLYYQRMFGKGPVKYKQEYANLSTFNRWIRGLGEGEADLSLDWKRRIFWSLNKTLGYAPGDPAFIIRIEAQYERRLYRKDDLPAFKQKTERAVLTWQDAWVEQWHDDVR